MTEYSPYGLYQVLTVPPGVGVVRGHQITPDMHVFRDAEELRRFEAGEVSYEDLMGPMVVISSGLRDRLVAFLRTGIPDGWHSTVANMDACQTEAGRLADGLEAWGNE